jgi:hypothetical protein
LTFAKAHGSRSPRRDVPKFQSNYTKVALTARRPSANRRDPASRLRRLQRRRLSNAAPRSYWRKTMTIYARGPRRRTEPPRQPLARAAPGATSQPYSNSRTTSAPNGCSNSGKPRRPRTRRAVCARRRSPNCSNGIASAASTPLSWPTRCAGRRCASPPKQSKPRAPHRTWRTQNGGSGRGQVGTPQD